MWYVHLSWAVQILWWEVRDGVTNHSERVLCDLLQYECHKCLRDSERQIQQDNEWDSSETVWASDQRSGECPCSDYFLRVHLLYFYPSIYRSLSCYSLLFRLLIYCIFTGDYDVVIRRFRTIFSLHWSVCFCAYYVLLVLVSQASLFSSCILSVLRACQHWFRHLFQ